MFKRNLAALLALSGLAAVAAEAPSIESVTVEQSADRVVTVRYRLVNAPAVVTLDVLTNGVSIGGGNIGGLEGDVNRIVRTDDEHVITWRPDLSWTDDRTAVDKIRAKVSAWPMDNPPDYMVVDLSSVCADRLKFYPDADSVPGGVLANKSYRETRLVMRKIHAKDVEWVMGEGSLAHRVRLASDYYIGVFMLTKGQWDCLGVSTSDVAAGGRTEKRDYRDLSYNGIVNFGLPKINALVPEVAFTLPSEAQWEFACHAGHAAGFWGDGSPLLSQEGDDANLDRLGLYAKNRDRLINYNVGNYLPNDYGLYDMHGLALEWCLDWYYADITGNYSGEALTTQDKDNKRVQRGGSYEMNAWRCTSTHRDGANCHAPSETAWSFGCRLACPATLTVEVQ